MDRDRGCSSTAGLQMVYRRVDDFDGVPRKTQRCTATEKGTDMARYCTSRPMIVDAVQCASTKTIATDLGFINVKRGDWVVCGEGGECYVVEDAFFRSTFISINERAALREADKPDHSHLSVAKFDGNASPTRTRFCNYRKKLKFGIVSRSQVQG